MDTRSANSTIKTFRDLRVWQSAKSMAKAVYHECQSIPAKELRATYDQIRRSSESVPHNIAEGFGNGTRPVFLKHLRIARGSLCELESQRDIAVELGILKSHPETNEEIDRTCRQLQALITSLERSRAKVPNSKLRASNK